jgi:hypothetical protein
MRSNPRRILFHIIIVLALIAVPLLLGSRGCGRAVHSEAVLTTGISN